MRIALLEDDADQAKLLQRWLTLADHSCRIFSSGHAFQRELRSNSFDLLLIDWMLPDISGEEVLIWVREYIDRKVPVLFVTQRDSEEDIVRALEQGADDYMVKPVGRLELLARINALGRRAQPVEPKETGIVEVGPFHVDTHKRRVTRDNEPIELTPKEFDLALFLFRNVGRLLSRGHILESVWGHRAELNTRTVDTHVSRLRRKLDLDAAVNCRLTAVYHHGYRLEYAPQGIPPAAPEANEGV